MEKDIAYKADKSAARVGAWFSVTYQPIKYFLITHFAANLQKEKHFTYFVRNDLKKKTRLV